MEMWKFEGIFGYPSFLAEVLDWCTFWIDPAISKHFHDIGHSKSLKQRNATG